MAAVSCCCVFLALLRIHTIPFVPTVLHYPIDVLRGYEMRVSETIGLYEISLVQIPGSDFYETYFEVRNNDGRVSKLMVAPDDAKWRRPTVVHRNGIIFFCDGSRITDATPRYDKAASEFQFQLVKNKTTIIGIDVLNFNGGWHR